MQIIDNTKVCKKHKVFWVIHVKGTECPQCRKKALKEKEKKKRKRKK